MPGMTTISLGGAHAHRHTRKLRMPKHQTKVCLEGNFIFQCLQAAICNVHLQICARKLPNRCTKTQTHTPEHRMDGPTQHAHAPVDAPARRLDVRKRISFSHISYIIHRSHQSSLNSFQKNLPQKILKEKFKDLGILSK